FESHITRFTEVNLEISDQNQSLRFFCNVLWYHREQTMQNHGLQFDDPE
ncbi:8827_t:CDS:1, partial [Gigaspora margarita]